MPTTDISICSNASLMMGGETISSLPGATREGKVCQGIYENTKNTFLASHPWRFTIGQVRLNRLVEEPEFEEFKYVFQLPAGFTRIIRVENNYPYYIMERKLFCDAPDVSVEYAFIPNEDKFPDYVTRCLELQMAALLSISIAEDGAKAQRFTNEFDRQLIRAKAIDNQGQPTRHINANAFIDVRF